MAADKTWREGNRVCLASDPKQVGVISYAIEVEIPGDNHRYNVRWDGISGVEIIYYGNLLISEEEGKKLLEVKKDDGIVSKSIKAAKEAFKELTTKKEGV